MITESTKLSENRMESKDHPNGKLIFDRKTSKVDTTTQSTQSIELPQRVVKAPWSTANPSEALQISQS
jgi:hypothetical protein